MGGWVCYSRLAVDMQGISGTWLLGMGLTTYPYSCVRIVLTREGMIAIERLIHSLNTVWFRWLKVGRSVIRL